jgi:hypothetical protein
VAFLGHNTYSFEGGPSSGAELFLCRHTLISSEAGWATGITGHWRGNGSTDKGRLILYKNGTRVYFSASDVTLPNVATPQAATQTFSAIKMASGDRMEFGVVVFRASAACKYGFSNAANHKYQIVSLASITDAPASQSYSFSFNSSGPAGGVTYTPNATPDQGTFKTPAVSGAQVATTFDLEGYTPHPAADSAYDYSESYDLQVYEALNPTVFLINNNTATTPTERTNGYFTRSVTLTPGVLYEAKFRHKDSHGVYSPWSATTQFINGDAPNAPTPLGPTGKQNTFSGYNYTATYSHSDGTAANAAQVEVYNSTGTTLLYDSGTYALSVADGGTLTVPEFHADLTAGTTYRWRMRARDTASVWGPYSSATPQTGTPFSANAAPVAPSSMNPTADAYTPTLVLTAVVSDPDGDTITAAQAQLETEAGVATSGSPYAGVVTGTAPNQVATFTIPSGHVTLGTRYRWRARATDGYSPGYGPYSADSYYRYQDVPTVTVDVVDPATVPNPSYTATYAHLSSLARTHARIVLHKYVDGAWTLTGGYDPGWYASAGAAGSTFPVTFPANTFRNNTEYRLKVYARDSGNGEGESPYYEFATAYTGPPALNVTTAAGDAEAASIVLGWDASTLDPEEFAGIEVQKATPGGEEDTETVALITDPAATGYTYHFPVSSRTYTLSVRQIENVGVEQVEGDWTDSTLSVDYSPFHFIKDAHDPSLFVAFDTQASRLPSPQYEGLDAEFLTWGGGVVQLAGRRDYASGEVAMEFYEEAAITQSAAERYRLAREILSSRRTLVLLTQVPEAEKIFVVRKGAYVKSWTPPRTRSLSFTWREARYSEDYYVRNAAEVTYTP